MMQSSTQAPLLRGRGAWPCAGLRSRFHFRRAVPFACAVFAVLVSAFLVMAAALVQPAAAQGEGPPTAAPAERSAGDEPATNAPADAAPEAVPAAGEPDWRYSQAPPDAAFAAYQRGRYLTAFKEAMARIDANGADAAAMTLVAELLREGLGVRENAAEAVRWYRLAADRGDAGAIFALGRAYLQGQGVARDPERARELFAQAGEKGHGQAIYNLGVMAIGGVDAEISDSGVADMAAGASGFGDFDAAAAHFRKAADLGSLDALYALAVLHQRGRGVVRDEIKAAELLKQAADRHHLAAMTEYAIALFNGTGVKPDERGAARYFLRAAWRNSPIAQNRLARLYATGRGVQRDMVQAMKWHVIARASGVADRWLDNQLPFLTRTQRQIVEEQVRRFAGQ